MIGRDGKMGVRYIFFFLSAPCAGTASGGLPRCADRLMNLGD